MAASRSRGPESLCANVVCKRPRRGARGVTLVELLVVIAILGALTALLLPAVQAAREAARNAQCKSNLHQLALALLNYEASQRALPKGDWRQRTIGTGVDSLATWVSLTLPYLEEANVYRQIDFSRPFFSQDGATGGLKPHLISFQSHLCPSTGDAGPIPWNEFHYGARGTYAANAGWAGADSGLWMNDVKWEQIGDEQWGHPENPTGVVFYKANGRPIHSAISGFGPFMINRGISLREAIDGLSSTIALAEIRNVEGNDVRGSLHFGGGVLYLHSEPPNTPVQDFIRLCVNDLAAPCASSEATWRGYHKLSARSAHPGGVNSLRLDGSVRFIGEDVQPVVWRNLSTFADAESWAAPF